ncbi:MAG: hypothetical protein KKC46_07175 [Proteobacteria bacterium]|nr:hypothetical protein [Pseudomonadota bacterium]
MSNTIKVIFIIISFITALSAPMLILVFDWLGDSSNWDLFAGYFFIVLLPSIFSRGLHERKGLLKVNVTFGKCLRTLYYAVIANLLIWLILTVFKINYGPVLLASFILWFSMSTLYHNLFGVKELNSFKRKWLITNNDL